MKKRQINLIIYILLFIGSTSFLTLIWYLIEKSITGNENLFFSDFILYVWGYGDIAGADKILKTIFAIIGILSLSLLSSIITVKMLSTHHKIKLSDYMHIWTDDFKDTYGSILIKSGSSDIFNVKLVLQFSKDNKIQYEEKYIPIIEKDTVFKINFEIAPNTAIFNYARTVLKHNTPATLLVLTSYIDDSTSQEHTIFKKYSLAKYFQEDCSIIINNSNYLKTENISFKNFQKLSSHNDSEYESYFEQLVKANAIPIDIYSAKLINPEFAELQFDTAPATNRQIFDVTVNKSSFLTKIQLQDEHKILPQDFTMICIPTPLGGNWSDYYDLNCTFDFDIFVSSNISVTLEIKSSSRQTLINPCPVFHSSNGYEHFSVKLKSYPKEIWKDVDEICFTTFARDIKDSNCGFFSVVGCELTLPDAN